MAEDEQSNETSEQPQDEQAQEPQADNTDASAAGPVEGEDSSSSPQAAGEEPTPTPPAEDASHEEQPQDAAPGEEQPQDDAPAEEPAAEEPAAEAEEAVAEEVPEVAAGEAEAPAVESRPEQPKAKEKKADVIPGADLEPIAVEPEAALTAEERARKEAEEEERARREAALTADAEEEASAAPRAPAKMESGAHYLATGKRKRSIARVILTPGSGKIEVNQRALEEFFPRPLHQTVARQPLAITGYEGSVDVRVRVHGGGVSGQAGAVRHGIARALTEIDPQLRGELKRRGFLTRDARVKERRKAGLKKARKRPQFSKR
jgi:small subunit ribosomal protein S9